MQYKIKVRTIWEFGKRKDALGQPHQEDSIYPAQNNVNDNDRVFILCDGMGGHDKGEVASAAVCETMGATVQAEISDPQGPFSDKVLQDALTNAFKALDAKDSGAEKKMGTTMTFLKLHSAGYTAAHIGDSRIYQFRPGADAASTQILFKTEDHSLVNDLIKIGELTEEEAKTHPQRNVITRAMQPHDERLPKADVHHSSDIRKGDFFYLCSDGMLEQADDANLKFFFSNESAVDTIDKKVAALRLATQENSDNHTAFVIEILAVDGQPTEPLMCNPKECNLLIIKDNLPTAETPGLAAIVTPQSAPINADLDMSAMQAGMPGAMRGRRQAPAKKNSKITVLTYLVAALLVVLIAIVAFLILRDRKTADTSDVPDSEDIRIDRQHRAPDHDIQESAPRTRVDEQRVREAASTPAKNKQTAVPPQVNTKPQVPSTKKPAGSNNVVDQINNATNTGTSSSTTRKTGAEGSTTTTTATVNKNDVRNLKGKKKPGSTAGSQPQNSSENKE